MSLTPDQIKAAIEYNNHTIPTALERKELQALLGVVADGKLGPATAQAVAAYQAAHGLTPVDGKLGPNTEKLLREGAALDETKASQVRPSPSAVLSGDQIARAKDHYRLKAKVSVLDTRRVQRVLGESQDGKWGTLTIQALTAWQATNRLTPTGMLTPDTLAVLRAQPLWQQDPVEIIPFSLEEQNETCEFTTRFEAVRGNPAAVYGSTNTDAEWEGWFDRPKKDAQGKPVPASQRKNQPGFQPHSASQYHPKGGWHVGLSYGAWQAAQEFGTFGELLLWCWHKAPDLFFQIMGGKAAAKQVLITTNLSGDRVGTRSPRVQPVAGADLWEEPWLGRFKELAQHEVFRQCQRDIIISQYLIPAIKVAAPQGFHDQLSLAVLFDISIQHGVGGMTRYLNRAVAALASTPAWQQYDAEVKAAVAAGKPVPHRPQDHIEGVIDSLPDEHEGRRKALLHMVNPWTVYTADSLKNADNPVSNATLAKLKVDARGI